MTRCTVAIPVFNRATLIRGAIESVLAQDVADLELLVVDNCSTDGTCETVESYGHSRVRLVRNAENLGLAGNLTRCLELSEGTYLRILCSDDRLVPGCLRRELACMDANPSVVVLSTRNRLVNEGGREIGTLGHFLTPGIYSGPHVVPGLLWVQGHYGHNPLNYPSGVLLRRDAAVRAGVFDTRLRIALDFDFFLRVLALGDLGVWDDVGAEILLHSDQESSTLGDAVQIRELLVIVDRHVDALRHERFDQGMRDQLAGLSFGLSLRHRLHGRLEDSRHHVEIQAHTGVTRMRRIRALSRVMLLRLLRRVFGRLVLPAALRDSRRQFA